MSPDLTTPGGKQVRKKVTSSAPHTSNQMIAKWKKDVREAMKDHLARTFAAMDKLTYVNDDQVSAVQEATAIGLDVGPDEFDEWSSRDEEIPDQALTEFLEHSLLSEKEKELLYENDGGEFSWIQYQLCQEILTGKY